MTRAVVARVAARRGLAVVAELGDADERDGSEEGGDAHAEEGEGEVRDAALAAAPPVAVRRE